MSVSNLKYLLLIVVVVLFTAGTCVKGQGGDGGGAGAVKPPTAGGGGGAVEPPVQPPVEKPKLPEIAMPADKATEADIATTWPAELPDYAKDGKYELVECYKSADGKHIEKVFLTAEKTADVIRLHDITLNAKGFDNRQVIDQNYFGRADYTNGKVLIVVGVKHDNAAGKNRVEISVHMK